jgi:hypothetical protein
MAKDMDRFYAEPEKCVKNDFDTQLEKLLKNTKRTFVVLTDVVPEYVKSNAYLYKNYFNYIEGSYLSYRDQAVVLKIAFGVALNSLVQKGRAVDTLEYIRRTMVGSNTRPKSMDGYFNLLRAFGMIVFSSNDKTCKPITDGKEFRSDGLYLMRKITDIVLKTDVEPESGVIELEEWLNQWFSRSWFGSTDEKENDQLLVQILDAMCGAISYCVSGGVLKVPLDTGSRDNPIDIRLAPDSRAALPPLHLLRLN